MKIYQIHQYGGEWEDRYDFIVESYLSEEKAKAKKELLEQEEAEIAKCSSCPLYYCDNDCDEDCKTCNEQKVDKAKAYCNRYEPFDIEKHDPEEYDDSEKCVNFYCRYEESFFKIEEVEVIE